MGRRSEQRFVAASYNIHRCVGTDGRYSTARVAEVLREIDADVVGLQEADIGQLAPSGECQVTTLASMAGYGAGIMGPTAKDGKLDYGNGLLTRLDVLDVRRLDLTVAPHEPRGALDVDLRMGGAVIRVVVTHLGLRYVERKAQVARLLGWIESETAPADLSVMLGDINEWTPFSPLIRQIERVFARSTHRLTFPARFPVVALDRIWSSRAGVVRHARAHRSSLSRVASDHLPVRAELCLRR